MNSPIKFDPTITAGNWLTIATLILGMMFAWFRMENRITLVEVNIAQNRIAMEQNRVLIDRQTDIISTLQLTLSKLSTLMDVYIPLHQLNDKDISRAIRNGQ